ncbi:hypothetical protein NDU88_001976 [Pleurodeles waltl]|uniref:Uncharacterized protein n=1 Tax=Pleurodeles waltl TaxID=8319 RepID=A0AAV7VBJ5_PLEWA|nr:hypothetical protein NDU88_001976 [Pleurodeles waltl]
MIAHLWILRSSSSLCFSVVRIICEAPAPPPPLLGLGRKAGRIGFNPLRTVLRGLSPAALTLLWRGLRRAVHCAAWAPASPASAARGVGRRVAVGGACSGTGAPGGSQRGHAVRFDGSAVGSALHFWFYGGAREAKELAEARDASEHGVVPLLRASLELLRVREVAARVPYQRNQGRASTGPDSS